MKTKIEEMVKAIDPDWPYDLAGVIMEAAEGGPGAVGAIMSDEWQVEIMSKMIVRLVEEREESGSC